jgi:ferrous iron transport protein A
VTRGAPAERTLDRLDPGERGIIARVNGSPGSVRRLMELGIVPGTVIEVVRRAPLGDPIELRVRSVHLALRREEAAFIHVAAV